MAEPQGRIRSLASVISGFLARPAPSASGDPGQVNAPKQIRSAGPLAWFGPFQPLTPVAPAGTAGRAFDYPVGVNLSYIPRGDASVSFDHLRALADNLPMLRIVIEKRKDQIAGWEWDISPKLEAKDKRTPKKPGKSVVEDPRVDVVREFLRKPDRRRPFHTWLRALVEDMLVIDAACIYPRVTYGGDLYSLDIVDGATVKVLIGEDGRIPLPDDGPAYQQILHGVPAADFSLDDLLYLPRNIRSNRLYGLSPVEQVILTINIALRREMMTLEYYRSGTIPEGFGTLPKEWTVDQIKSFQDWFDSLMAGNLAQRRTLRFMPDGFKFSEVRQAPLKDQYDEWLWRIICAAFGTSPAGVVPDVNRATAQSLQLQASHEGIGPLKAWVKEIFDDVIQRIMGFKDLEFRWQGEDELDPLEQAQALQIYVSAGIKTEEEARVELGLGPMSPADKAAIAARNAPPPAAVQSQPGKAKGSAEVGKRAAVPFLALTPLDLDRAALKKPQKAMRAAWKVIFTRQAKSALSAIEAIRSKLGKTDAAPDAETVEQSDGDLTPDLANLLEIMLATLSLRLTTEEQAEIEGALADAGGDSAVTMLRQIAEQVEPPRARGTPAVETPALPSGVTPSVEPAIAPSAEVPPLRPAGVAPVAVPPPGAEAGIDLSGDIFDRLNTRAIAWAHEHAGELASGVNDTTREAVRASVAEGMGAGERYTQIIARVKSLGAFSDERAALIAETEIANANSMGALNGLFQARDVGVTVKKAWLTAASVLERVCVVCRGNEAAGPIELEAAFPSGDMAPAAHPRCRCALIPYIKDHEK